MRWRRSIRRARTCAMALACGLVPGFAGGCAAGRAPCVEVARPSVGADLVREAIGVIRSRALGAHQIDWGTVEHELLAALPANASAAQARPLVADAVRRLGDPHASVTLPAGAEPTPEEPPRSNGRTGEGGVQSVPTPHIPTRAEARILDDGVAYILVPGCAEPTVEGLRDYAGVLRAELLVTMDRAPSGWVIDLRLNGGGNIWPMLLGLQPLLGEGVMMTSLGPEGPPAAYGVSPGEAWIDWGSGPVTQLDFGDRSPPPVRVAPARVAVIIGPWTMSSGEALAICLRTLPHTREFGETTAGLTTVTNGYPLSDGSVLVLPVSVMGDRAGVPAAGSLTPGTVAASDGWPGPDDSAARAARAWAAGAGR